MLFEQMKQAEKNNANPPQKNKYDLLIEKEPFARNRKIALVN
jgi:hypothetical protein